MDVFLFFLKWRRSEASHRVIKRVRGISWLWRLRHDVQGNLTQHWRAGVFREQIEDAFQDFSVYVYQLDISSTQTTPDGRRSHFSLLLQHFQSISAARIAAVLNLPLHQMFSHTLVTGMENSLSDEAFGRRVERGQFHSVGIRGAHLKQNPLVREKLTVLPMNAVLINLNTEDVGVCFVFLPDPLWIVPKLLCFSTPPTSSARRKSFFSETNLITSSIDLRL